MCSWIVKSWLAYRMTEVISCGSANKILKKMYGRPYNRLCQLVRRASPAVIKLYDIRANVRILDRWTMPKTENMQARAKDIGKLCSQSIGRWEEWIQEREGPAPEMEIAARAAQDSYDRGQW